MKEPKTPQAATATKNPRRRTRRKTKRGSGLRNKLLALPKRTPRTKRSTLIQHKSNLLTRVLRSFPGVGAELAKSASPTSATLSPELHALVAEVAQQLNASLQEDMSLSDETVDVLADLFSDLCARGKDCNGSRTRARDFFSQPTGLERRLQSIQDALLLDATAGWSGAVEVDLSPVDPDPESATVAPCVTVSGDRLFISAATFVEGDSEWKPHVTEVDLCSGKYDELPEDVDCDCSVAATVAAAGPVVAMAWKPFGSSFEIRLADAKTDREHWLYADSMAFPALALQPNSGRLLACVSADLRKLHLFRSATGKHARSFELPKPTNEGKARYRTAPTLLWLRSDVVVVQRPVPGGVHVDSVVHVHVGDKQYRCRTSLATGLAGHKVMRFEQVAGKQLLRGIGQGGTVVELRVDEETGKLAEPEHVGDLKVRCGSTSAFAFEPSGRPFVALASSGGSVSIYGFGESNHPVPKQATDSEGSACIEHVLWVETGAGQRVITSHDDATVCISAIEGKV